MLAVAYDAFLVFILFEATDLRLNATQFQQSYRKRNPCIFPLLHIKQYEIVEQKVGQNYCLHVDHPPSQFLPIHYNILRFCLKKSNFFMFTYIVLIAALQQRHYRTKQQQ